jgi:hypothetical protein
VVISESGQPNGRPYRACTTKVRRAKARGRTGAAAARGKRKRTTEGEGGGGIRAILRMHGRSLSHLAIRSARAGI